MEALRKLVKESDHVEAKQQQARWLAGYQIVIAQVIRTYGDGGIPHPLASFSGSTDERAAAPA